MLTLSSPSLPTFALSLHSLINRFCRAVVDLIHARVRDASTSRYGRVHTQFHTPSVTIRHTERFSPHRDQG